MNVEMDFTEEELSDFSTGSSMKQVAKVTFDRNSSKVTGWESIWSILEAEDQLKGSENMRGELERGVEKYKESVIPKQSQQQEQEEAITPSANLINLKGYVCEETGAN